MVWRRPYKVIEVEGENRSIKIYGNSHNIPTYSKIPEWAEDKENCDKEFIPQEETAFMYRGVEYFISEFLIAPEHLKEFDGIYNDSFFSGILIKMGDDNYIKAYTYVC